MRTVLRWWAKPRLNYIDFAGLGLAYGFSQNGHWWASVGTMVATILVSVLAEQAVGHPHG